MPDVLRLRYVGAHPVTVPLVGREVQPEELIEVPGRAVNDADLKEHKVSPSSDAFLALAGNPPQVLAFPLTSWSDETPAKTKKGD